MNDVTLFQYCPKLIIFSADQSAVLLARRKGEADYDGTFTFIGGKTETTDGSLLAGIQREKNEEIGPDAKVKICWSISCFQAWYQKASGQAMVLPHHVGIFEGGEITLSADEYAEYKWVPVSELEAFEPKIPNIPEAVAAAQRLLKLLKTEEFVTI